MKAIVPQTTTIVTSIFVQPVQCANAGNGYVAVSATGGNPPYTFELHQDGNEVIATQSNGQFYGLSGSTYYVRVTDSHGCSYGTPEHFTIPQATPVSVNATTPRPACAGDAVNVKYNIFGGQPPYNVSLSPFSGNNQNRGHFGYFTAVLSGHYSIDVIGMISHLSFGINNC